MVRFVALAATRDLIPFYGVYAVLFVDRGLSAGAVSSLFVIWSVTGFVFEVPSGAWADTFDKRRVLVCSSVLWAVALGLWTVWPTYPGFALGFALWGLSGALVSGTYEALLYEELSARRVATAYPKVLGWSAAAETAAATAGIVLAAPLYAAGGYLLVGWVSVAVAVVSALVAWSLPAERAVDAPDVDDDECARPSVDGYLATLRAGVGEATRHPVTRRAVVVAALLYGLTTYDEYLPLVADERGASTSMIPLLLGIVAAGQLVVTALAGRTSHLSGGRVAMIAAAGAVLLATGGVIGNPVVGFAAFAAAFGLAHNAVIISEARLQDTISGRARATVTSVSGLATELVVLAVYAGFAVGSPWLSVGALLALSAVPTLAAAWVTARWLPDRQPVEPPSRSPDPDPPPSASSTHSTSE